MSHTVPKYPRIAISVEFGAQQRLRPSVVVGCAAPSSKHVGPTSYCEQNCSLEAWRRPLGGGSSDGPPQAPIVALGKFDALHRGHQLLAVAAAGLGGAPWLVSFSGMAEVLGWHSRLPLVAPSDRRRVLQTWRDACGGQTPSECSIPFGEVRSMSPEAFIDLLATELRVAGVVVGSNYRFGYKAAGTAALLQELAPHQGMRVKIIDLLERREGLPPGKQETVSSSRVRAALMHGDMEVAELCLGRPYRLIADVTPCGGGEATPQGHLSVPSAAYHNQPPAPGRYRVVAQAAASGWDICHVEGGKENEVIVGEEGLVVVGRPLQVPDSLEAKLLLDFIG